MRVAIIHYWLVRIRGGEKVVDALCEMFPDADLFTHVYSKDQLTERMKRHHIRTSFIAKLPFAERLYQWYLPLMPIALEQLDLREYDLIISSESGPAKGVLTRPDSVHVCYCHTPMRYVWNMYLDYLGQTRGIARLIVPWLMHRLRIWDVQSAQRVDLFVANSRNTAHKIRKYYGRESIVIHPPVDVDAFSTVAEPEGYYLCVGELVRYKRFDLAIAAFNALRRPLTIIGDGEEYFNLKRLAGDTITFLGRRDLATLQYHLPRCLALVFPGEEDFGIVPVEAMAAGRPVIAFRRGGALETVVPGTTGVFFDSPTAEALAEAVVAFERSRAAFDSQKIRAHAQQFSREIFRERFTAAIADLTNGTEHESMAEARCDAAVPGRAAGARDLDIVIQGRSR
jgi:glycosyltransferase involved in cell wall biosynthesis